MSLNLNLSQLYRNLRILVMTKKLFLLLAGIAFCFKLIGQTEAEVLSQANKLFKNEKYVEATPLYLRLLSLSPKNAEYNFRYGTCLLFNADRKQEALRYLKFAAEDPNIDPLAFYFLGKAYHVNYLFNDAVRSYDKFATDADAKLTSEYPTKRLIETSQNGRKLLTNYSEMIVYEKKEIEQDKFFRLYNLEGIGGNIVVTAEYQSKLDKKNGHIPLIYFGKGATTIYYSSYGETGENGKEIYRKKREASGTWGEPELVKGAVNTPYDEDYSYLTQDGQYLYFSSKGHNSMGGYDVFRSKYNAETDAFEDPENMDFAVSSPEDDIFFLVDANNENGYFASARQSETGKLYVYKIRVDKLPTDLSIIAGKYESKISSTPPKLKVQVENSSGQLVGNFESDAEGQIVLSFPTGGQYKYKMNLQGSEEIYTANVNVPSKRSIKPLRQSFMHFMENDKEVVRVLDRFDETVMDKDNVLASIFSEKAKLNPNADKFDVKGLSNKKEEQRILAEVGAEGYSMSEIATEMEGKARAILEMEENASATEKKAATLIEEEIKVVEALNKQLSENAIAYRGAEVNSMTRQNLLTESKELLTQKEVSEDKIQDLLEINKKVQDNLIEYKELKQRAVNWEKKGAELQQLLKEDKNAEALQLIALNKTLINSAVNDTVQDYQTLTSNQISKLNKDLTTMNSLKFNYETSSKDLQNNIDYLERFLMEGKAENPEETKKNIELKKKDLSVIQNEIKSIEEGLKTKRATKEELTDELSEYKQLDGTTMPDRIALMQTAKDHLKALNNTPEEKEADYIAEVIKDFNEGNIAVVDPVVDPVIDPVVKPREAMNSEELIALVNPEFKDTKKAIEANNNLTAAEQAKQLETLEHGNTILLAEKIQKVVEEINENPDNMSLLKEKKNLDAMLKESQENVNKHKTTQEIEESKEIAKTLDINYIAVTLDKNYEEVKSHIKDDSNIDNLSQLRSLNDLDESFVTKIEDRKTDLQKLLKEEPNKAPQYNKELSLLNDLVAQKGNEMASRKTDIENLEKLALSNPVASAFSKMSPKEQEQTILNELDANYVDKKEAFDILTSSQLSDLQAEVALDREVIASLNKKKQDLDPQTQLAEIKAIERLLVDAQADITQNQTAIKQIEESNSSNIAVMEETNEEIIGRVAQDYPSKIKAIQNDKESSELEKAKDLLALDKALVSDLQAELSRVNENIAKNPNNVKLNEKQDQIDEIIAEKSQLLASRQEKITELENQIAVVDPLPTGPSFSELSKSAQEEKLKEQMNWTYEEQKNTLEESNASVEEKINAQIALDKATLKKLADEKSKLDNVTQKEERAAIERIEENVKTSMTNNQLNQLALSESAEELIDRIDSDYADKKAEIEANRTLEELEKIDQLIALEKSVLDNLESEKQKYQRLGNDNPQVPALLEKAKEIDEIISNQKSDLATLNKERKELADQVAVVNPVVDPITNPADENAFAKLTPEEQEATILDKIQPTFLTQKQSLETEGLNSKENLEKHMSLNKGALKELGEEKGTLDPTKNQPEIAAIERLETQLRTEIKEDQVNLRAVPETPQEMLSRVAKTESADLTALLNDDRLTELEKAEKSLEINKDIRSALEKEMSALQKLSRENPDNDNIPAKIEEIQTNIRSTSSDIASLESKVEKLSSTVATTDPIIKDPVLNNTESKEVQNFNNINEIRSELLQDAALMEKDENTLEALKEQLQQLDSYENDLKGLDSNYQYLEDNSGENFKKERRLIAEELVEVETRKKKAKITLGELEMVVETENTNEIALSNAKFDDPGLQRIVNEENELREAIETETSMKEARKIESKLIQKIDQRIEKENDITQDMVGDLGKENKDKLEQLKSLESSTVTERLSIELTEKKYEEIKEEIRTLEDKAKKANSVLEEAELLDQALEKQIEAKELLESSYMDAKVDRLTAGKINSFLTNEEMEAKRKNLLVEEVNLNAQIAAIDAQIKVTTKEKEIDELYAERQELVEKRTRIDNNIAQVDRKIADSPKSGAETLPANAMDKELTYMSEREIAASEDYKKLSSATYDAMFLEREINFLLKSIDMDKIEAQELVQESIENPGEEIDQLILKKVKSIEEKQTRLEELKVQLAKRQVEMDKLMPKDPETLANVKNMLSRGVDPMSKFELVDFVAIPENGFSINTNEQAKTNVVKPITAQTPTGLMYRVQIGAFSKPVNDNLFNEFTPVSAEKKDNGILVYLAGYFDGNGKARDAQKSIRNIGYKDAFVVAYCDGKRITLSEAQRLEETKACTPIQVSEISLQATSPKDTTKIMVTELDYYKGIGAAPALPVETKKGLFYTVQLGVFNRPVSKEVLKNMSPLITKRLPNGQIRYSAGVYVSIEEAFPKRQQAFEKGIVDAYITAYYDGERITLDEAEKLLQKEGTGVIEKTAIGIVKDVQSRLEAEQKLAKDIKEIVKNEKVEGLQIQLVSRKQFDEFPRDILNRFNSHASFYFDINDKRIKSSLYDKVEDIPQVYFLRNELDTTYVSETKRIEKVKKEDLRNVTFEIPSQQLGGDLADLLLRLNYRKEFVQVGEVIKVLVHEVPSAKVQAISDRLRTLKIRAEVEDPLR